MTTKAKHSVSPILPPEIWDHIFDLATHVPGTLVPEIYDQSSLIGPLYNSIYHPKLRAVLVTERHLVRVCKQWWYLASPYLYRSVYIETALSLASLHSTLMRSAVGKGKGTMTGRKPLGMWTQRLDIVIRDYEPVLSTMLADVIHYLPNLVIASFPFNSGSFEHLEMPATVLDALRGSAASLRVLDFSYQVKPADKLAELLRACSQLCVLNCRKMVWSHNLGLRVTIPNVTTLWSQALMPPLSTSETAKQHTCIALKELIFDPINSKSHWRHFMRRYGRYLTAIQLDSPFSTLEHNIEYIQLVQETCPNIRRLTMPLDTLKTLRNHISLPLPPIEYLGLRAHYLGDSISKTEFQRLFLVLARIGTTTPSIRVVQFMSRDYVDALLGRHAEVAVDALRQVLVGCRFRLEDDDGHLLEDRLKALGHMS